MAVRELYGVVGFEKTVGAIFVTTRDYTDSAKKREQKDLVLKQEESRMLFLSLLGFSFSQ